MDKKEPVAWQVMVENEPMKEFSIKDMAHDWAVTEKLNGSKYSYWIRPLYPAPPSKPCAITDLLQQKFQSGNNVPVERVTITRSEYEAALRSKNT